MLSEYAYESDKINIFAFGVFSYPLGLGRRSHHGRQDAARCVPVYKLEPVRDVIVDPEAFH